MLQHFFQHTIFTEHQIFEISRNAVTLYSARAVLLWETAQKAVRVGVTASQMFGNQTASERT
jgi:hypothetical protein